MEEIRNDYLRRDVIKDLKIQIFEKEIEILQLQKQINKLIYDALKKSS